MNGGTGVKPARNNGTPNEWREQSTEWRKHDAKWPEQPAERPSAPQQTEVLSETEPTHPDEVDEMLKSLRLPSFRQHLESLIEEAETHQYSYRSFLSMLCAEELAARKQRRINREVVRARLPEILTIDDIDFTYQTSVRRRQLGSYLDASLVTEGRCAIFLGSSGNAKTALATAITYQAIQNGFTARFTPLHLLISTLARATKTDKFDETLAEYIEPDVLCIDEIGYLILPEQDAANVLYRVVDARHQAKKPMILTTNKALAAWGQVLHDGDLAGAIIDRVLARGQLFELRGLSYRTRHIPPEKLGVDAAMLGAPRRDDAADPEGDSE